jgi:hypothetical protein
VIRELKFHPRSYGWNKGDNLLAYSLTLGRKLIRNVRLKTNIVKKRWANLFQPSFKLK